MKEWMSSKQYAHLVIGLIAVDLFMSERLKKELTEKEVLDTIGDPINCPNGRALLKRFYDLYFIPILPYWEKACKKFDESKQEHKTIETVKPFPAQKKKRGEIDVEQLFS